jgi:hypothetical protein
MDRLLKLYHKYPLKGSAAETIAVAALQTVRAAPLLVETKHRIGKDSQEFKLENWLHSPDLVVGRWVAVDSGDYCSPKGAYSWGVWWKNKSIGAYRMHDQHGNLMAYRLDVLKDVVISKKDRECHLEFSDLVVDMWIWPTDENGRGMPSYKYKYSAADVTIEDLDELDALRDDAKLVSMNDCLIINKAIDTVLADPNDIISDIDCAVDAAVNRLSQA